MIERSSIFAGIFCLIACGGGSADTSTQTAPTATTTTTAPPANAKTDQCHAIATRVDAFTTEASKVDMHQVEGMNSLQTLSTQAATDLGAMHADAPLADVLHESSTHLAEASKIFAQLSQILSRIEDAKKKIGPDQLTAIKACVVAPVKTIATYCKAHSKVADCTAVKTTLDAWGTADNAHQGAALASVQSLAVTDATIKPRYAEVVKCVQPLSDALTQIEQEKAKLAGIGDAEDAREKKIDESFNAQCGRKLFNNK